MEGQDEAVVEGGRQDPTTARLETFSDGVIAIAITLLVLELKVPHAAEGQTLANALAEQWPSYAAYAVSFLTIGIMWVNHHHMFTLIERTDHRFLILNVIWLMTIAVVPWPTALVADQLREPDGRLVAALVYGGIMVAIAIMFSVVWRYAAKGNRLLDPNADRAAVERINRSYSLGPVSYLVAALLAFIEPRVSLGAYAAMAVFWSLSHPVQGRMAAKVKRR